MAAGFPWSERSEREREGEGTSQEGAAMDAFSDLALKVTHLTSVGFYSLEMSH